MITSPTNKKVRYTRTLHRRRARHREQRFIVEGVRLVEEALGALEPPIFVLCTPELAESPAGARLLEAARRREVICHQVAREIMALVADTVTPQGILGVVPFPHLPVPEHPSLLLLLDAIKDPGNMGTILRTAAAAGVDGAIVLPGTVDVYSPKVVRAAMGAHFHLAIESCGRKEEMETRLKGYQTLLAAARGGVEHWQVDWSIPTALIVSSEAHGAGELASRWATSLVSIPMAQGVESLNVASAAAILLFESVRQRQGRE